MPGTGMLREAEIHWFGTHGVGRRDFKTRKVSP